MPEADAARAADEHARGEALLEGAQLAGHERFEKPQLGVRGRDRGRVQEHARIVSEPGTASEHRVANRRGNLVTAAARTSLTKNGFPPVSAVEVIGLDAVRRCERLDRLE